MQRVKHYKCPECKKVFNGLQTWSNHVLKQHPEIIPKGWTPARFFYYLQTGKTGNKCIICKQPTEWNEASKKYERFCRNPQCKQKYREIFKKRMINKYGKTTLLDDPEQQRKMLEAKKAHGFWEFSQTDHTRIGYNSTYEMDFLRMMDEFLKWNGNDIMAPSPHTYYYEYQNENDKENEGTKMYIPDYFIPSLNLEIEIKQNTSTHPKILAIDKIKEDEKDKLMYGLKDTRYIKITDKDYTEFFNLLIELQETMPDPPRGNKPATYPAMVATESVSEDTSRYSILHSIWKKTSAFGYGWMNGSTPETEDFGENFMQKYRTMEPKEFASNKIGICYDYAAYYEKTLRLKYGIEGQCYYIFISNGDDDPINMTHSVYTTTLENGDHVYLEGSYKPIMGIYRYEKLDDMISYIIKHMCKDSHIDHPEYFVVKFDPRKFYGMTAKEYMSAMAVLPEVRIKYNKNARLENITLNAILEAQYEDENSEDDIALEGFFDIFKKKESTESQPENILKSWKEKIFGNEKNYLVGGAPHTSPYVTFNKVLVDDKRGIISLQNINIIELISRIRDTWEERRLDYIFDRTYRAKDIVQFNKKRLSRSQMRITSLTTPVFFALELVIIFRELYNKYRSPVYARIAKDIYDKTWLSKSDKARPEEINLKRLDHISPNYKLKPHQLEFIKLYPSLKAKLNLRGYYLAFDQGLGKTLTASALAEVVEADRVYIVCPNTLTAVWKSELHDYFGDRYQSLVCTTRQVDRDIAMNTKYFIVNNESIGSIMPYADLPGKKMIIVDEAHNFRNFNGQRVADLINLRERADPKDVLLLSGTPIKAIPNEMVPALMMLDPNFTYHAAEIYNSCFKFESYMAMDIVKKRFGQMIYRKTKNEVLNLPEKYVSDLRLKIKNPEPYYMQNVHDDVQEAFHKWYEILSTGDDEQREKMINYITKYSTAGKQKTDYYIRLMLKITDRSMDSMDHYDSSFKHELDKDFFETFVTNYIETNPAITKKELDEIRMLERKFIRLRNSAMGKAIGEIYPPRRAALFNALFDENKKQIENMILSAKKKTVIFSQLLPTVNHIHEMLNKDGIKTVKVVGGMKDRMDVINSFRHDDSIRVIIATSQTMGTGVTLTEASLMFFFGPPWRSTDYDQCCDRIYRIGQTDDVYIWNVRLDTEVYNLSDRMNKILNWSSQMFHSAIDQDSIDGATESSGYIEDAEEARFYREASEALIMFAQCFKEYPIENDVDIKYAAEAFHWSTKDRYPVFVLLTEGHSPISGPIRAATHSRFSHASISMNIQLNPMYSFGTKQAKPWKMGFVKTYPSDPLWGKKPTPYALYVVYINRAAKEKMKSRLEWFEAHSEQLRYYWVGLLRVFLNIRNHKQMKWFCSEFVATILSAGRDMSRDPSLYKPGTFVDDDITTFVCEGDDIRMYKPHAAENALRTIRKAYQDSQVDNYNPEIDDAANEAAFKTTVRLDVASIDDMMKRRRCFVFANNTNDFMKKGIDNLPQLIEIKNKFNKIIYVDTLSVLRAINDDKPGIDISKLNDDETKRIVAGTKCKLTKESKISAAIAWLIGAADNYLKKNVNTFVFLVQSDVRDYALIGDEDIAVIEYGSIPNFISNLKGGLGNSIKAHLANKQESIMLDNTMKYAKEISMSKVKSKKMNFFHISQDPNLKVLSPRYQKKTLSGENVAIPRVCVATSATNCLRAMPVPSVDGFTSIYVYAVDLNKLSENVKIYRPSTKYVSDANMTDEHWLIGGDVPVVKVQTYIVYWSTNEKRYKYLIMDKEGFKNANDGVVTYVQAEKVPTDNYTLKLSAYFEAGNKLIATTNFNAGTMTASPMSIKKNDPNYNRASTLFSAYIVAMFKVQVAVESAGLDYLRSQLTYIPNEERDAACEALLSTGTIGKLKRTVYTYPDGTIEVSFFAGEKKVAYVKIRNRTVIDVYVDPEYRNRGYAKKMINIAVNRYEANKAIVPKVNAAAKNVFLHTGWSFREKDDTKVAHVMRFFY